MTTYKSNKNLLVNRLSTLRYEIAHSLTPDPVSLPLDQILLRNTLLSLDGKCEYCRINKAAAGYGDHFYAVIKDKYPSIYCNDTWNSIPSCSTCNASKGNKTYYDWFSSKAKNNPLHKMDEITQKELYAKFKAYDSAMKRYCQKKYIDKKVFDRFVGRSYEFLSLLQSDITLFVQQDAKKVVH